MNPHMLKSRWFDQALRRAQITPDRWRPNRGVDENRRTIGDVYTYYGELFVEHPYLLWAGMAGMIGPAFYAGFKDVGLVPDAMRRAVTAVFGRGPRWLARAAAGDLGFYETTFLKMQKKIFEDQAMMHEAYITGGLPQIDALYRARIIDIATLRAWQQIDAGRRHDDWAALVAGNRALLFREQYDIIDRFYIQMLRFHHVQGRAFTYLLTLIGTPSIPGADSYPERYPFTFATRLARAAIKARTPLADGNIAVFADRWKLIEANTLPRYLDLVREDIGTVKTELQEPVCQRMARYRLLRRGPALALSALTDWDWDISIHARPARPDASSRELGIPAGDGVGHGVCINLRNRPTNDLGSPEAGGSSRVWMNRTLKPLDVAVALPGHQVYRARALMAVMLSSTGTENPGRLIVQLPPTDLAAAWRLIAGYAAEWHFPVQEADRWRDCVDRRAPGGQSGDTDVDTYGTHVFTADDVGFVHLEFQVSHHRREGQFVVSALFSWPSAGPGSA
jgi:hypothetical protein